jgi:hypothetical protein
LDTMRSFDPGYASRRRWKCSYSGDIVRIGYQTTDASRSI